MKKVYIAFSMTIRHGDPEVVGVGTTIEETINIAQEPDLIAMVKNNEGHITVDEAIVGTNERSRVFDTFFDEAWEQFTESKRYPEEE